ncbi:methyltransferase-like 22 [Plakobranchus ocellatus]|uniref:Methyltransferase-like 22 n=1 Tax=Plakobranchus ocellatus TaxID=259542 RepID=A0AAV3YDE9_9GAST|nr:methyltransferase-like 22 [Plakobranchus ocellatus]
MSDVTCDYETKWTSVSDPSVSRFCFVLPPEFSNSNDEKNIQIRYCQCSLANVNSLSRNPDDMNDGNPASKRRKSSLCPSKSASTDFNKGREKIQLPNHNSCSIFKKGPDKDKSGKILSGQNDIAFRQETCELDEDGDLKVIRKVCQNTSNFFLPDIQCPLIYSHPEGRTLHANQICSQFTGQGSTSSWEVITLEHRMETFLRDVGHQLWAGALLLCDYLIYQGSNILVQNPAILDLGAGLGMTSIIAAMFASSVICTDFRADIVAQAERNWHKNRWMLPKLSCKDIAFKVLDWTSNDHFDGGEKCLPEKYALQTEDRHLLQKVNINLGAEVIYDEDLTDAFFKTIYNLLLFKPSKDVLITLEKRMVFETGNLEVCSPAYEHFQENIADLVSVDELPVHFSAEQINTDFPQFFQYTRNKEMELWKISSQFTSSSSEQS